MNADYSEKINLYKYVKPCVFSKIFYVFGNAERHGCLHDMSFGRNTDHSDTKHKELTENIIKIFYRVAH